LTNSAGAAGETEFHRGGKRMRINPQGGGVAERSLFACGQRKVRTKKERNRKNQPAPPVVMYFKKVKQGNPSGKNKKNGNKGLGWVSTKYGCTFSMGEKLDSSE